ncbi:ATP-NAD kinase-like domain-containing protein [Kalaharituber pfeilii]|nr:ATP-NAD kinase-like domain-containing protein [Kalaharituber pfeilii]
MSQGLDLLTISSTLSLGIADDSLQITDNRLNKKKNRSSCGSAICDHRASTRQIPLYDILWAQLSNSTLTIDYAEHKSKTNVKPATLEYPIKDLDEGIVEGWCSLLLERAYGEALPGKRVKVLLNPYGGQGLAAKLWATQCEPLFRAAHCKVDVEQTTYHQHAMKIAEELDISAYDTVACVSGDGIPHEVFNGFAKRKDAREALRKIVVCQLPGGSGNGMCWTLTGTDSGSLASLIYIKGVRTPIDLVSVTQGDRRLLSMLSQSFGIVAEADLGTEDLRWMGGFRFTWGLLTRIWGQVAYPCDIAYAAVMDDKDAIREYYRQGVNSTVEGEVDNYDGLPPLKYGTVNDELPEGWSLVPHPTIANFYAGNMSRMSADATFFPAALPNEGLFDVIIGDSKISRMTALKMLAAAPDGSHYDMDCTKYQKVEAYRLVPRGKSGYISIDGEAIEYAPFQAEVHRGLGTVLTKDRKYTGGEVLLKNSA